MARSTSFITLDFFPSCLRKIAQSAGDSVNAFNADTGAYLGQLKDPQGNVVHIDGLWGLAFGTHGDSLYFAAGPDGEAHGLVGVLKPDHSRRR